MPIRVLKTGYFCTFRLKISIFLEEILTFVYIIGIATFCRQKMNSLHYKNISAILAIIIAGGISLLCLIGYGHKTAHIPHNPVEMPAQTHLSIIYERTQCDKSDFLHLKIDTTYHKRGKNSYLHEVVCNHNISLRAFDKEYSPLTVSADRCFVADGEFLPTKHSSRRLIASHLCHSAIINNNGRNWAVWYSEALPYCHSNTKIKDKYRGVVLAAYNNDKSYALEARHITLTTI